MSFNNKGVLEASDRVGANLDTPFESGWLRMEFNDPGHQMTDDNGAQIRGLPRGGLRRAGVRQRQPQWGPVELRGACRAQVLPRHWRA
ncbi:MAG: hypothetical protein U5L11_00370 [Arhodomonas sp.]|nr:hypothetical protein [Arhodomonas sp.]